jgi:hypothetical protein
MKKFEAPNLSVLEIEMTDVITTSFEIPDCPTQTEEDRD